MTENPPAPIVPAQEKDVTCHMSLALFTRRKTLLSLHYAGSLDYKAMQALAEEEHCEVDTVRRDWDRRSHWEALIWNMMKSQVDPVPILNRLELAEENALRLIQTAKNEAVQVAALKAYPAIVTKKMELLQALGKLPKIEGPQLEVNQNITNNVVVHANLLQQYTTAARNAAAADIPALRPGQSVHSNPAPP